MLLKEPETSVFGTNRTSRAGLLKEVEERVRRTELRVNTRRMLLSKALRRKYGAPGF
jgi:hypothetical protein